MERKEKPKRADELMENKKRVYSIKHPQRP
jgi:hypothetical protein